MGFIRDPLCKAGYFLGGGELALGGMRPLDSHDWGFVSKGFVPRGDFITQLWRKNSPGLYTIGKLT